MDRNWLFGVNLGVFVVSGENQFNVRLGKILTPNGAGRFVSFAGQVRRAAQRSSRSSGGRGKKGAVTEQYFSRRVIVKVHLVKMGAYGKDAQRHHLDYIQSCLLYTSPSPRDQRGSRMPSSA